jgi:hypothetical protein
LPTPLGLVTFGAFALSTLHALHWLVRKQGRSIPRAVSCFIASISLLDGVLVSAAGHATLGLACLAGYVLTRVLQRYVAGT